MTLLLETEDWKMTHNCVFPGSGMSFEDELPNILVL